MQTSAVYLVPKIVICSKCGRHGYYVDREGWRSHDFTSKREGNDIISLEVLVMRLDPQLAVDLRVQLATEFVEKPKTMRERKNFCDALYPIIGAIDWSYWQDIFARSQPASA